MMSIMQSTYLSLVCAILSIDFPLALLYSVMHLTKFDVPFLVVYQWCILMRMPGTIYDRPSLAEFMTFQRELLQHQHQLKIKLQFQFQLKIKLQPPQHTLCQPQMQQKPARTIIVCRIMIMVIIEG